MNFHAILKWYTVQAIHKILFQPLSGLLILKGIMPPKRSFVHWIDGVVLCKLLQERNHCKNWPSLTELPIQIIRLDSPMLGELVDCDGFNNTTLCSLCSKHWIMGQNSLLSTRGCKTLQRDKFWTTSTFMRCK